VEKEKLKSKWRLESAGDQKIDSNWGDDRSGKGKKDKGRVEWKAGERLKKKVYWG